MQIVCVNLSHTVKSHGELKFGRPYLILLPSLVEHFYEVVMYIIYIQYFTCYLHVVLERRCLKNNYNRLHVLLMIQKFKPHYYNCTDMILNDPRLSKRIVIRYPCRFLINFDKVRSRIRSYH